VLYACILIVYMDAIYMDIVYKGAIYMFIDCVYECYIHVY